MSDAFAYPHPVGVLGGMGPAATWDFCAKLLAASRAPREQDNVRVIVDCNPHVPDRHAATAGGGPSAGPALAAMARGLEGAGARALVIACNSAHVSAAEVRAAVSIPLLDLIEATADAALEAVPGVGRVGVLAAGACLDADLYGHAFAARGVETVAPQGPLRERFMALLWKVKAGDVGPAARGEMAAIARALLDAGAEAVVAGCTEVPLVLAAADLPAPLIDSTDVLVARTLRFARTGA